MKSIAVAIAAAAIAVLAGCGSDSSTPPPTSAPAVATTSAAAKTSTALAGFTAPEQAFLRTVDASHVPYLNAADMVGVGRSVCDMLKINPDPVAVATSLARQGSDLFNLKETAAIVGAARGSGLCT